MLATGFKPACIVGLHIIIHRFYCEHRKESPSITRSWVASILHAISNRLLEFGMLFGTVLWPNWKR